MRSPIAAPRAEPILFAHRGASGHAPANTIEAFRLAAALGATGIETDAWCTRDGEVVLLHDGTVRHGLRRRAVATLARADLPGDVPSLDALLALPWGRRHLSVDVRDPAALDPLLSGVARVPGLAARTWLCHPEPATCAAWVGRVAAHSPAGDGPRIVHSERLGRMAEGPERRFALMADAGVAAVSMHRDDWTGGLVALAHRFGLEAIAWDVRFAHQARALLDAGCDALHGDWPDRLVDGRDGTRDPRDPTSGSGAR